MMYVFGLLIVEKNIRFYVTGKEMGFSDTESLTWIDLSTLILFENDIRSLGKYSLTALTALIKLSNTGTTCKNINIVYYKIAHE